MEKHNIFKLSAISVALLGIASQGYGIDCYNKTIMEGFLSQDSSFLSNKCTYDLTGETNIDPEIELKNSNAEFNDTTILVSGDKKSKRYSLGFHHYLGLLPLSDNSNVVFNNSNISILSYSTGRPLFKIKDSKLVLNKSNASYFNSEENLENSLFSTYLIDASNSNIGIEDSTLNSNNTQKLIYVDNSILNIKSSKVSNSGKVYDSYSMLTAANNSKVDIQDSHFILSEADDFILGVNSDISFTNSNLSHTKEIAGHRNNVPRALMTLRENSNMVVKESIINSDKGDGLFSLDTANISIQKSELTVNDKENSVLFIIERDNKSNIDIKDSILKADRGFKSPDHGKNSSLKLTIENSKINTLSLHSGDSQENSYLNAKNSELTGYINDKNMSVNLDDSKWSYITHSNKYLKNLSGNSSVIDIGNSGGFYNLIVNGNLSGNIHFDLNTDLAKQQSDKIVVKGEDSGNFTLGIKDSGNEPNAANGKVTLVETQTGQAQFSLKDREYVDAGAYRYRLNKEGTNWVLANRQAEPVKNNPTQPTLPAKPVTPAPTEPTQPAVQPKPVAPTQPVVVQPTQPQPTQPSQPIVSPVLKALSEKTNALISLRQAQGVLLSQNLQGVHQRLGELKTDKSSNVWVKNTNSRSEAKAQNVAVDSRSSGFEMDSHSLQIGADRAVNDHLRLGGFVGASRADVDFDGEYGKGKLRSQAVGLYATFANEQGWYLDNIAKYERLTAKFVDEKRKYNGFSLSSEIGKRFALNNDWSITPQAQLAYHTINGKADESRLNLFTARAGVRVAKGFALNNGWNLQPYAEVNAITEKANNAKVRVNQYQFDVAENKGRVQTALGLTAGNSNHRLGLEASITSGSKFKQPLSVLANYRYQW